jgi:peptidase E
VSETTQQIIALGGGGFSMEPENPALDLYILEQARNRVPKVCLIPTASGDSDNYIRRFYEAFCAFSCLPRHLSLFRPASSDLAGFLLEQDVIYVGGGNTRNLLALWREWRLGGVLRLALESGVILAGISAGAICWFEEGVTDSMNALHAKSLARIQCLGFLAGSSCPHYDGEANRRPEYHRLIQSGEIGPGLAADDGVALHFVNGALETVVSSRRNAGAYVVRMEEASGRINETPIRARYLG